MLVKSRSRLPLHRLLADFKRGPATVIVWLLAITATALLFTHRSQRYEYIGLARGIEHPVASEMGGRIESLLVDLCEDVQAGDVLVKLDDSLLNARIETARASVRQLDAQLTAARLNLSSDNNTRLTDWQSKLADFQTREERYRIDALSLNVSIESDRIEAQRLNLEMERLHKLLDAEVTSQRDYDMIKLRNDQLQLRIAENTALVAKIESDLLNAIDRREEFVRHFPVTPPEEDMIAPIRGAIHKEELVLEELRIQRTRVILRATVAGRVSQVLCQVGQVVSPSEPILLITQKHVTQAIGYITENDATPLRENMTVHIARADQPQTIAEATILRLGIGIEELPARLWRDPRRPEFGRSFLISIPQPLAVAPNEKIIIRLGRMLNHQPTTRSEQSSPPLDSPPRSRKS